jgi:hypothetical protein
VNGRVRIGNLLPPRLLAVSACGLCILSALWCRSRVATDRLSLSCRYETCLSFGNGQALLSVTTTPLRWQPEFWYHDEGPLGRASLAGSSDLQFAGFAVGRHTVWSSRYIPGAAGLKYQINGHAGYMVYPAGHRYEVAAPLWFPLALTAIVPGYYMASIPKRRQLIRRANRLCIRCGYDLRASTGRCPECGTTIPLPDKAGSLDKAGEDRADGRGTG